jgi:hypothetical protein
LAVTLEQGFSFVQLERPEAGAKWVDVCQFQQWFEVSKSSIPNRDWRGMHFCARRGHGHGAHDEPRRCEF